MKNRLSTSLFSAAFCAGVSCAALAQSSGNVSAADKAFMQKAAADGIAEVQMGQTASTKSSDPQIKQFAQRIVDDHTKANDQLKAIALAKQVTLPSAPDASAQKESKRLDGLKGKSYDQAWSKDMVAGHQAAVALFTQESTGGTDSDVRQFATTTLPTLKTHLQMAQQLNLPSARDQAMDSTTQSMNKMSTPMTPATPATPTVPAGASPITNPSTAPGTTTSATHSSH
jgi:putative membrane protein